MDVNVKGYLEARDCTKNWRNSTHQFKTAKHWLAEESKKMQKNVLKHQFEKFSTASNESLDKAYDRFQKLISQLEVHDAPISKEDINQKFLRSLPSSWNQIALIMINKPDIDEIDQMDGDDSEELDLRWQVAMLTVRSKIECYNYHRKGHFARECRSGRSQGRRSYSENDRSNAPTNESLSQALVAQDGLGGYDWSNDFKVEPVNYTLMAISSSSSSSSSDSEVQKCSKCLESFKCLQKNYDTEREKHNKAKLEIRGYEIALESLESRILGHEKNELAWGEKYEFQNYELKCREIKINNLNMELEKVVKERDELKYKITKWEESTKNIDEILNSQMSARDKTDSTSANDRSSKAEGYKAVPPPITRNFLTPRADISFVGLDEYAIRNKIIESQTSELDTKTSETTELSLRIGPQMIRKKCLKCKQLDLRLKHTDHLIKDCNFHDKKSQETKLKNMVNTGQKEGKPVWDNTKRVNHQNFSKYPHLSKTFVPSGVLTRTGFVSTARPVCTARPSVSTARPSINTARPVSTARPSISTARPSINTARPVSTARPSINTARPVNTASTSISTARPIYASRPMYPRIDNIRPRGSCSLIKRSYYTKPAFRPKDLKQDVKTFGVKNMTTAGTRAVG
ncbi:ribonuclease H-like domain-containing protein, partial [Tanacetum coccineum]